MPKKILQKVDQQVMINLKKAKLNSNNQDLYQIRDPPKSNRRISKTLKYQRKRS